MPQNNIDTHKFVLVGVTSYYIHVLSETFESPEDAMRAACEKSLESSWLRDTPLFVAQITCAVPLASPALPARFSLEPLQLAAPTPAPKEEQEQEEVLIEPKGESPLNEPRYYYNENY